MEEKRIRQMEELVKKSNGIGGEKLLSGLKCYEISGERRINGMKTMSAEIRHDDSDQMF